MNGNPHYVSAISAYSAPNANASNEFNEACRADAQIQATLALAFEQRTANLIAFEQGQWSALGDGALTEEGKLLWLKAAKQVVERLGLE